MQKELLYLKLQMKGMQKGCTMKVLTAYYPGNSFPAFSVTGRECQRQCEHCKGRFLKGMLPVTPDTLITQAYSLHTKGAEGFLLSGGCDEQGRINLMPFLNAIKKIKNETGLKINVHTGFLNKSEAAELIAAGIDCFCLDIVQDLDIIRNKLNLDISPAKYAETLEVLQSAPKLVPHVCVSLQSPEGEKKSLQLISQFNCSALVVLGLMYAEDPKIICQKMPQFVSKAVKLKHPVIIGCMRPRRGSSLELECIAAGASAIVNPSSETLDSLTKSGWEIVHKNECCSLL